jgi:hypothetical protein
MKQCPACHADLPDNAVGCANCGGSYLPDGRFETKWEAQMDELVAERERKVQRAEAFGRLGKPHTSFFLEDKAGGCLVAALLVVMCVVALGAVVW